MNAQEQGKFRFDIGLGYASSASEGGAGLLVNLEPKYTINNHMNVGLRAQVAAVVKGVGFTDETIGDPEVGGLGSYLGVFDYYLHKSGSSFAPFVGGGLGYFGTLNVDTSDDDGDTTFEDAKADGKFGGMIRLGFDWFKFRMAAEYNIVPESDLLTSGGNVIGQTKNSYIGISLGFYFGGGKWKRS